MNLNKKLILLASFLTLSFSPVAFAEKNISEVKAQDTSIKKTSAETLLKKVRADKGKVVVVNIFASWCPPCREETPGLIANRKNFSEKDVVIYGVSVDKTQAAYKTFIENYPFNYPVFLADEKFIELFKINAIPQMLIYNKKGDIAVNHKGLLKEEELATLIQKELDKK